MLVQLCIYFRATSTLSSSWLLNDLRDIFMVGIAL